jgi:hypothetical protein
MIQELKVKNFLSFKDEVTFSFEATRDTFAEDYQVVEVAPGVRLLRFAMVYGANASGKTNLLKAFEFLRAFWRKQASNVEERTGVIPFLFDRATPNEPSRFELVFYVGGIKHHYLLELDESQVYLEKLCYYKSVQPTMLFVRKFKDGNSDITYNPSVIKLSITEKEKISVECLKNMSFFAAIGKVNVNMPDLYAVRQWMISHFEKMIDPTLSLTESAEAQLSKDDALRNYLVNYFRNASFDISDIKTQAFDIPTEEFPFKIITSAQVSIKSYQTYFEHLVKNEQEDEKYKLHISLESYGTRRIFGLATAIYNIQKKSGFLLVDEIEASLHPKFLAKLLFEYFKDKSQSQMLVTIHDDSLLDLVDDLIRKDSIWFTEKKESGTSDLYRLTDFRGLNRLSSIRSAYRLGRFGATMK